MIELGRYQRNHIPRENRLCPLCKSNQVENESHFLSVQCSRYSFQRDTFLNKMNEITPDYERKSTSVSFETPIVYQFPSELPTELLSVIIPVNYGILKSKLS